MTWSANNGIDAGAVSERAGPSKGQISKPVVDCEAMRAKRGSAQQLYAQLQELLAPKRQGKSKRKSALAE